MDEIDSLRQQLAAAESLVENLRTKLRQAEDQYAAAQHFHDQHLPQCHNPATALQQASVVASGTPPRAVDLDPRLGPNQLSTTDDRTPTADGEQPEDGDDSVPHSTEPFEFPLPEGTTLPSLEVKTFFPSLSAVKEAVEAYALAQGWTPHTKKRDRVRICMGCRAIKGCPYHVRAESCLEGARISSSKLAHTCGGNVNVKRHQTSRLTFLKEEVPKFMEITPQTPAKEIQDAIFQRFGTRISLAQCTKLKGRTRSPIPAFERPAFWTTTPFDSHASLQKTNNGD
ncbi:hypothetical protein KC332_g9580 [Hortaea werneckii]|nr:hypothetical protein KC358_g10679 [Hortaea werneckii]KAI6825620.1 hypothetical protein KC350_g8713 [Hortaea werneckii]KAI6918317.1 hypothetical protein KC348_g10964 [Hortaea werneckii]KAI6931452.1 hypothetical protein KC341_g9612 [Hortaea werneckii]KAI6955859.1 hypothetical protein KC321_g15513 [Hortaea werneckii]